MRTLIVGMGEVGNALKEILSKKYEVYCKDFAEADTPEGVEMLHVCLNYHALGHERFMGVVKEYADKYKPKFVDICSTVPPGTTRLFGPGAVHSTTRGLHPNLAEGLLNVPKHIGGGAAKIVARYFQRAGIRCITHRKSETTELAHILNNAAYGVSLMFADEMAKLCREYGVDYYEAVMRYTATHNAGFRDLDHDRLVRPILTPPYGCIGGHCLVQGASLIPLEKRGPLLRRLSTYNEAPKSWVNSIAGNIIVAKKEKLGVQGELFEEKKLPVHDLPEEQKHSQT